MQTTGLNPIHTQETPEEYLDRTRIETIRDTRAERPENTTTAYARKQAEFVAYCTQKGFSDGQTVTDTKLAGFLRENVINRPKANRYQKIPGVIQRVGHQTVLQYASAITDLYQLQHTMKMNSHPNPRTSSLVKGLLSSESGREHDRKKRDFVDRGLHSINDGISEMNQVLKMSIYFIKL
jgi:hypothetical protein